MPQLTLEQITALYTFGQFQYTYGNYSGAADYLYHFRILSTDSDLTLSASWGKLACDILSGQWDTALEELNSLRETIDSRTTPNTPAPATVVVSTTSAVAAAATASSDSALAQLQSRTWLLHWSLFVYFNHAQGRSLLLDTFLSPAYLSTIQTSSPWILRYLSAAAILTRYTPNNPTTTSGRSKYALKEIVRIIQMEEYQYSDPITRFLKELYVEFDFEEARRWLEEAEGVVARDFFLAEFAGMFLDCARWLVSEAYCRIHQKIDIESVFAFLTHYRRRS
jgi:translation initiation factor 3 subunit E